MGGHDEPEWPVTFVRNRRSRCSGIPTSNHRIDAGLAVRAVAIIKERYADFGPTLACEKLRECHHLKLLRETVRHLMIDAGLWTLRVDAPLAGVF
jgi:hypothetical protein